MDLIEFELFDGSLDIPSPIYTCSSFMEMLAKINEFMKFSENKICFIKMKNTFLVCKVALRKNILQDLLKNEINVLRLVHLQVPNELKTFYQELSVPSIQYEYIIEEFSTFILTKFCAFQDNILTFREFVISDICNDIEFRSCLFQIIASVRYLQTMFPGFRHNDFKADNILLKDGNAWTGIEIQSNEKKRKFKLPTKLQTTLIDFENAWWVDKPSFVVDTYFTQDLQKSYGIYETQCNGFDLHLLFYDLIKCVKHENQYLKDYFKDFCIFVNDFFPSWMFENETLTNKNRLLLKYQTDFLNLDTMLLHPYFYLFRNNDIENYIHF